MTSSWQVYGREVVEAHYRACLYAGVNIGEQNLPFFKIISLIITIVTMPSRYQGAPMRRWCQPSGSFKWVSNRKDLRRWNHRKNDLDWSLRGDRDGRRSLDGSISSSQGRWGGRANVFDWHDGRIDCGKWGRCFNLALNSAFAHFVWLLSMLIDISVNIEFQYLIEIFNLEFLIWFQDFGLLVTMDPKPMQV